MKILHTSDWHIGQVFYNYDRSDEHLFFFEWLCEIVGEYKPDVMVVCGDIFHTANPSIASQNLYIESLIKIHNSAPKMTIVVTAGNHDSGSRIEMERLLWKKFNVKTIGFVGREVDSLEKHIIPIGNPIKGYVIAVPHCYPQNFPALDEGVARKNRQVGFYQKLINMVKERNIEGVPVIMMIHSTVTGSNPGKQELTVGGLDSIDLQDIDDGVDYLALGHIHFPQDIGKNARYCGSPLPISFNEVHQHGVTIIECNKHGEELHKKILTAPLKRNVVTIPQETADFEDALAALEAFPDEEDAYIRLNVKVKQYGGADWAERAMNATSNKRCRYCCLLMQSPNMSAENNGMNFSQEEFKEISPLEIAKLHWRENRGEEMDEELVKLMKCAIDEIENE